MDNQFLLHNKSQNSMLIVDDEEMVRDQLASIFEDQHSILTAASGEEGVEEYEKRQDEICAILLDVNLDYDKQKMNGIDVLRHLRSKKAAERIPIFLITGETDTDIVNAAYDEGVMDVISKPITPKIVKKRVHSVMELYAARNHFEEVVAYQTEELQSKNETLNQLNTRLTHALATEKAFNQGMIEALATATEFRSGESGEHVRRIHDITRIFLTRSPLYYQYTEKEIDLISNASILHDVGKISIPDAILNKPGRFTDEEFQIMKSHTLDGEKLLTQIPQLRDLPFFDYACRIARYHHERWDGKGYPDGLKEDQIPMCAQIVSLADVYDALVSNRVYKPRFTHEQTVHMIMDGQCGVFNPLLLDYFQLVSDDIKDMYLNCSRLEEH